MDKSISHLCILLPLSIARGNAASRCHTYVLVLDVVARSEGVQGTDYRRIIKQRGGFALHCLFVLVVSKDTQVYFKIAWQGARQFLQWPETHVLNVFTYERFVCCRFSFPMGVIFREWLFYFGLCAVYHFSSDITLLEVLQHAEVSMISMLGLLPCSSFKLYLLTLEVFVFFICIHSTLLDLRKCLSSLIMDTNSMPYVKQKLGQVCSAAQGFSNHI